MNKRVNNAQLPNVSLINMQDELKKGNIIYYKDNMLFLQNMLQTIIQKLFKAFST